MTLPTGYEVCESHQATHVWALGELWAINGPSNGGGSATLCSAQSDCRVLLYEGPHVLAKLNMGYTYCRPALSLRDRIVACIDRWVVSKDRTDAILVLYCDATHVGVFRRLVGERLRLLLHEIVARYDIDNPVVDAREAWARVDKEDEE